MNDYHINVFRSDNDGCYVADIPDLRFCSAIGDTAEDAFHEVQIAKKAWLKTAKTSGKPDAFNCTSIRNPKTSLTANRAAS